MSDGIQGRRVLVVDDDVVMRDVLSMMLGAEGYAVMLAESGEDALALLEQGAGEVDIVLTDMHLPGVQGLELAQRLKVAIRPETVLMGMSGSEPTTEEKGSFIGFLEKPFSMEGFEEALALARGELGGASAKGKQADGAAVLDEGIFGKMQAMMPAAPLAELYRMTLEDVRRRVMVMRAAADRGDMVECRAEAHSIKGGCGMVGASELSALAAAVERGVEAGNPSFVDFDEACARLQGMLEARIR